MNLSNTGTMKNTNAAKVTNVAISILLMLGISSLSASYLLGISIALAFSLKVYLLNLQVRDIRESDAEHQGSSQIP